MPGSKNSKDALRTLSLSIFWLRFLHMGPILRQTLSAAAKMTHAAPDY